MFLRALILDTARIKQVREYADKHRYDLDKVYQLIKGKLPPPGDHDEYCCFLNDGYKVVYSIEQQEDKKWYQHLSVSVNSAGKLPSIPAVEMLTEAFGMGNNIHNMFNVWIENGLSVNVLKETVS